MGNVASSELKILVYFKLIILGNVVILDPHKTTGYEYDKNHQNSHGSQEN